MPLSILRTRRTPRHFDSGRRRAARYPIALPVRYRFAQRIGWGRTVDIGTSGALFTTDEPLRAGAVVELCIGWPALLNEKVHLNLVAQGVVVRAESDKAAVSFTKRAFRTSSSSFFRQALLPETREA